MRTAFQIATVDIMILYGSHHQDEISIVNIVVETWMLTWGPLASEFEMYWYDEDDDNDLLFLVTTVLTTCTIMFKSPCISIK
jgi:hypothetical protein